MTLITAQWSLIKPEPRPRPGAVPLDEAANTSGQPLAYRPVRHPLTNHSAPHWGKSLPVISPPHRHTSRPITLPPPPPAPPRGRADCQDQSTDRGARLFRAPIGPALFLSPRHRATSPSTYPPPPLPLDMDWSWAQQRRVALLAAPHANQKPFFPLPSPTQPQSP